MLSRVDAGLQCQRAPQPVSFRAQRGISTCNASTRPEIPRVARNDRWSGTNEKVGERVLSSALQISKDRPMQFAAPRTPRLDECYFYHRMDLPGVGTVGSEWDLRGGIDAYLGQVEFAGRSAVDVGTASGQLCFEMERRGATVVGYDLSDEYDWDIVPYDGELPRDVLE